MDASICTDLFPRDQRGAWLRVFCHRSVKPSNLYLQFFSLFVPYWDQTGWLDEYSVLLFLEIRKSESYWFERQSSQTDNRKIDICRFLARRSSLLGECKDWLAQCPSNVTESDIRSWYRWPGFLAGICVV